MPGVADAYPRAAAPLSAVPAAGSAQRANALYRDVGATYAFTLNHTNGVQTHLQVPGGAFLDDTFLTTTEIVGIGTEVSSVVAAVRVEPGDLVAELPITVTFVVPDAMMATLDTSQLVGFVADADGSNLHLVPLVAGRFGLNLARPGVKLERLGIAGIALASPSQQAALASAWPADTADQLAAALAPALTAKWRSAVQALKTRAAAPLAGMRPLADAESPMLAPLRGYFNDVVVPAFAAAYGDPALSPSAIQTGLAFLRQAALTGLSEPGGPLHGVVADLEGRIGSLLDSYADYVAGQCRTVGGPPQLQLMMSTIRTLQLMGRDAKASELTDTLPQCSRFRATFSHDFQRTGRYVSGGSVDVALHAVIEGGTTFGLDGPVTASALRLTSLDSTTTYTGANGVSRVIHAKDDSTATWAMFNLSVPVIRTRAGTASTSVELTLNAYGPTPLTATETIHRADGTSQTTPRVTFSVPLSVPALPRITGANYGPVLIPASGRVISQATRTIAQPGGSLVETERVTITLGRAE